MNKKIFFFIIIVSLASIPVFAGVSIDIGISALGNAVYIEAARPMGAIVTIGVPLFEYKAIVQLVGGFFTPPFGDDYNDPVGSISAGVLYSPMKYLYMGFRTGFITPPDAYTDAISYGSIVFRVQKPGKGFHYFAETEIGLLGILNRFSMGFNFTL